MKLFFPRFSLLAVPLVLGAQSPSLLAAPLDRNGAATDTAALPWLKGILPNEVTAGDEFSRAAAALEKCRAAERDASRRATRGEITQRELQTYRSATQLAQQRVEALLSRDGKPHATLPIAQNTPSAPPLRVPALVSLPPVPTTNKVPVSILRLAPRVTAVDQNAEGKVSSGAYGYRSMHAKIKFIAMLPTDKGATSGAAMPQTAPETKTAVAPALPPATTRNAAPISLPVATLPPITTPAKPTAPKPPENEAKNAKQSAADLQRLAQLDAALQRADKRLSAANEALSEGQQQLTRFAGTLRQAMMEAGPDAVGLHPFVKVAEKYAGTPYVWGGESRNGFDCSGMIIRVMRDLGYQALPHSAAEQFRYGKPIAQELLKPGDLVFFANTYKAGISHVGIYLGKRRFIHAAGTGKGTIVSSLDMPKFQQKYAGARRLIASRGD